jgi:hypothetical protein
MGAPKCPQINRLRSLTSWLQSIVDHYPDRDQFISKDGAEMEVIAALEWLTTFLENRNLYHKRQQLKNKHLMRLAKEHGLFDESTKKLVDAELFDHVANQGDSDED